MYNFLSHVTNVENYWEPVGRAGEVNLDISKSSIANVLGIFKRSSLPNVLLVWIIKVFEFEPSKYLSLGPKYSSLGIKILELGPSKYLRLGHHTRAPEAPLTD